MAWVNFDLRQQTESEIKVSIHRRLKEAGIEIPFPQRDLHIRSDATQAKPAAKPKPGTRSSN
jgi:potassium efflux system protein